MTYSHLPCRCGAERGDVDTGSGHCAECRKRIGKVSTEEMLAAFDRCDRSTGGSTPRVAWVTPLAPQWLWRSQPPAKERGVRVLVIPIDEQE